MLKSSNEAKNRDEETNGNISLAPYWPGASCHMETRKNAVRPSYPNDAQRTKKNA